MQKSGLLSQYAFFGPSPPPSSTGSAEPELARINPLASIRAPLAHRFAPCPLPMRAGKAPRAPRQWSIPAFRAAEQKSAAGAGGCGGPPAKIMAAIADTMRARGWRFESVTKATTHYVGSSAAERNPSPRALRQIDSDPYFPLFGDPAVAEPGMVLDLVEGGVDLSELFADSLYERADVRAVPVAALTRHEAPAVHEVVKLPIRDILPGLYGQLREHAELAERELDRLSRPAGAFDVEAELKRPNSH
jgi:hypothetical protein